MKKGKLIVLDGTDGSGKRTQLDLLKKRVKDEGFEVEELDFPRYYNSFYGELVARYLRGEFGDINETSPYLSALPYAGDRLLAKEQMEDWLEKGKIVLTNRYVPANLAHQSAKLPPQKRNEFIKWLIELEYEVHKLPKEDLVIYLNVPLEIAQKLIKNKDQRSYLGGFKEDIHEKNTRFLQESENQYKKLSKRLGWQVIDCVKDKKILPKEVIAEQIWDVVRKVIS